MSQPELSMLEIANKWRTDKAENGYIDVYEKYFEPLRYEELNILEIGVKRAHGDYPHGAASHRTWKEYFPNSQIFGIDIDPKNKEYEQERLSIHIGSQHDPKVWRSVLNECDGDLDIIIDDGSHVNILTLASFCGLFPHLKSGGWYVIEDMGSSYLDLESCHVREKSATDWGGWFGMHLLPKDISYVNNRRDMTLWIEQMLLRLDLGNSKRWAKKNKIGKPLITEMHFYEGMCWMKKV